jgi:aspartate carbamoyltransferase catalytic subunit
MGPDAARTFAPHVLDARQFPRDWLEETLFPRAAQLQSDGSGQFPQMLSGKRLFSLFYEPSTRTRVSFAAAFTLLGGTVFGMDDYQARVDEESLEDRVRVINEYPYDFLLLRSRVEGGAARAARVSRIPVINAGDAGGQHPTQALVDAYTLWREFGRIEGLRIALVGDLSYERSTTSLAYLLAQFPGVRLQLVAPRLLGISGGVQAYLTQRQVSYEAVSDLRAIAGELDAVYITRAHTPRLEHALRFDHNDGHYGVDGETMSRLPNHARVLHPLPRGAELPPEFDDDERIACFRQAGNGLYVRMALLSLLADNCASPGRNIEWRTH